MVEGHRFDKFSKRVKLLSTPSRYSQAKVPENIEDYVEGRELEFSFVYSVVANVRTNQSGVINADYFRGKATKGDWLTQEFIAKQKRKDQAELFLLNTIIQCIAEKTSLTRGDLLKILANKSENSFCHLIYWRFVILL
ncbi:MAG: hypothetical protein ACW98F_16100 [Candidatus Hodarchaeales archaeon]|jgi:hypothetical protein